MPTPDEFPKSKGADNTKAGIEARKAKLLKNQLSTLSREFHSLIQESYTVEVAKPEDQEKFFKSLGEIITKLLKLNPFGENLALKTECQEVLSLVEKKRYRPI